MIEQAIDYYVPSGALKTLRRLPFNLSYEPEAGEFSAQNSSEEENFLAVNLTDDVLRGSIDVEQAR